MSLFNLNTFGDIRFLLGQCTCWKLEISNVFDAQRFHLAIAKLSYLRTWNFSPKCPPLTSSSWSKVLENRLNSFGDIRMHVYMWSLRNHEISPTPRNTCSVGWIFTIAHSRLFVCVLYSCAHAFWNAFGVYIHTGLNSAFARFAMHESKAWWLLQNMYRCFHITVYEYSINYITNASLVYSLSL